jgi:hypothetical protein
MRWAFFEETSPTNASSPQASPTTFDSDFESDPEFGEESPTAERRAERRRLCLIFALSGALATVALAAFGWNGAHNWMAEALSRERGSEFKLLELLPMQTAAPTKQPTPQPSTAAPTSDPTHCQSEVQYDEDEAKTYVQYALAAFCTRQHIELWDCGTACDTAPAVAGRVVYLPPGSSKVQGYVGQVPSKEENRSSSFCIAAFRGSVNSRNWFSDLKFWENSWPPAEWTHDAVHKCANCEVHAGYAGAYAELREELLKAYHSLDCEELAFTGHSLGAAVATVAAMDARMHGRTVRKVYTFGSPLVGNEAFANMFNKLAKDDCVDPPSWRIVHHDDPVPHLEGPFENFHHVDREVFYIKDSGNEDVVCREGMEDPKCSAGVPKLMLLSDDHVTYLGQSFRLKDLPRECQVY